MAFNPGQLEVLQLLLNLSPEQRSRALQAALLNDQAPLSPRIRRAPVSRLATPISDDSSITNSEGSRASGTPSKKRVHSKNRVTRLSSKICREYLNSERMWTYLYNDNNRVIDHKLDDVLDQIYLKLEKSEQKTIKTHKDVLKKALKKRMASGRRYRKQQKLAGKTVGVAHKSCTIDLTGGDGDDDDVASSETPIEEIQAKTKSEPKEPKKESPAKPSKRKLAKDFADRMQKRRNVKKRRKQTEDTNKQASAVSTRKSPRKTVKKQKSPEKVQEKTFPYPLGTLIARDFDGTVFTGKITQLYPDDPTLCQVTYEDGDKEDFDADQASYACELYARDCCGENSEKS